MAFDREAIKQRAAELAAKGVFIGTSSWKYEGWFGQLYTPTRYEYCGKVAKTRFPKDLSERIRRSVQNGLRGCERRSVESLVEFSELVSITILLLDNLQEVGKVGSVEYLGNFMSKEKTDLLQGTLDMLVLKALQLGSM